jgi:hypothetical protein
MQKYTDVVTSARSGAAIPSASVTVKTSPGGVTATIYSDDGVTTQANPLTTDSNGEFTFYAADGEYTLTVSGTGITSRTIGPVILHDPADSDDYMPSTDVSFTQSGTGAVARTVQARGQQFVLTDDYDSAANFNTRLAALDEQLGVASFRVYGKAELNPGFTNSFDTVLWIAGANRTDPTTASQGLYVQHRVTGDAGAVVHDAAAAELRLNTISNATFLNAFEASVEVTGGANTIADMRSITANMGWSGAPTGTVTSASVIRAQAIPTSGAPTVTTAYGLYVEAQTVGGTNYSVYAPTGTSRMGILQTDGDLTVGILGTGTRALNVDGAAGSTRSIIFRTGGTGRWIIRANGTAESGSHAGSNLEILARADDGGANVTPLTITRSNGAISFANVPMGFYGATAIARPSSTGETTGFTAGTGTAVNDDSTFTGNVGSTAYRISDIVKHLKNLGLITS